SGILTIRLAGTAWTGTNTVTAKRIIQPWKEKTLKHSNAPSVTATNSANVVVTGGAADAAYDLDIAAMLNDVAGGGAWYGVRLEVDTSGGKKIWSGEAVKENMRPKLTIFSSSPPLAPNDLNPSGGHVLDDPRPFFTFNFRDPEGDDTQASLQFQMDDTSDLSSPVYDSGTVAIVDEEFDLGRNLLLAKTDSDLETT